MSLLSFTVNGTVWWLFAPFIVVLIHVLVCFIALFANRWFCLCNSSQSSVQGLSGVWAQQWNATQVVWFWSVRCMSAAVKRDSSCVILVWRSSLAVHRCMMSAARRCSWRQRWSLRLGQLFLLSCSYFKLAHISVHPLIHPFHTGVK